MNNSSLLANQTYTGNSYSQHIPVNLALVVSGQIVSIWTILANLAIIVCFVINRNKIWPSFSTQILSLSVSDMCVGLGTLPLAILSTINVDLNYGFCSLLFYSFFASQCASLYHIFGICVHRCVVIHRANRITEHRSDVRVPISLAISAWVISLVVCLIPHVAFGDPDVEIRQCIIQEVFKGHMKQVTGFLFIVYFVPHLLTTVLYLYACFRLRYIWKKVFPSATVSFEGSRATASVSNQGNTLPDTGSYWTSVRVQKKVIRTIGVLLLIFNVCTIPLIVLLRMESQEQETRRNMRAAATSLFVLNSALNPFVYALETGWLKIALKQMFKDLFLTLFPCYD